MSVLEQLNLKLENIGMDDFYRNTKDLLIEEGLVVIDPHKNSGNKYYSLIGIMPDGVPQSYSINIIHDPSFIRFAEMEITVLDRRGVSHMFEIDANGIFSYILYPLLKDNDLFLLNATLPADEDATIEIVRSMKKMHKKVSLKARINRKTVKKTYIGKSISWSKKSDNEVRKLGSEYGEKISGSDKCDAFRSAMRMFRKYMEKLN